MRSKTRSKHIKGSKEGYLLRQNTAFGVSHKTTLKQELNSEIDEKWDGELNHLSCYLHTCTHPPTPAPPTPTPSHTHMYALCVSGAVNTQGIVWKFLCPYINFHLFIHSFISHHHHHHHHHRLTVTEPWLVSTRGRCSTQHVPKDWSWCGTRLVLSLSNTILFRSCYKRTSFSVSEILRERD